MYRLCSFMQHFRRHEYGFKHAVDWMSFVCTTQIVLDCTSFNLTNHIDLHNLILCNLMLQNTCTRCYFGKYIARDIV